MGYGQQADGGFPINSYQIQYATFPDFRDATNIPYAINSGTQDLPVILNIGPQSGYGLQTGVTYYVRAAAINSAGVGPFCDKLGILCNGDVLAAIPSPNCP